MKIKNLSKLITIFCFGIVANAAKAQLVNCNVFLQGNYVEVGININGAFGSSEPAPGGYHERGGVTMKNTCTTGCSGTFGLGFVADPAKDGWGVGTPSYFGDYFLPGSPQEGWSLEVNGTQSNAWNENAGCGTGTLFTGSLSGTNVSYATNGVTGKGTWKGRNADSIEITQVTRLDTNNLYFTISVTLKNTSAFTRNNVYYMRTVDPDNEVALTSNYTTINNIDYQLPNTLNATLVTAVGTTYSAAFLGLGTLDCRAKCFFLASGLTPGVNCDVLYAEGASTARYTGTNTADAGIGLVFNLGNIASGDSVTLAYAYILKAADLFLALQSTSPDWSASGDSTTSHATGDTARVCQSTLTTVSISNPGTYTWNWTAITGETLSAYTGPSTQVLTGSTLIVLRAIGTGSCIGTPDTLYTYINPGRPTPVTPTAGSNSPICAGNALNLTSSTSTPGVTYAWSGPLSFSSTVQNPTISGATVGASGVYSVTAGLNGCTSGIAATTVTVNPSPAPLSAASAVLCIGGTTTFTDATPGGTWTSSAPGVATVSGGLVTAVSAGVTTISYSLGTCVSTASVTVNSAPAAITPGPLAICAGSSGSLFNSVGGGVWSSSNTAVATVGSTGVVIGISAGTVTITYAIGPCTAFTTVTVNPTPAAITPSGPVSVCIGTTTTLSDATAGGVWSSTVPSIATVGTGGVVTGVSTGVVIISYSIGSCAASKIVTVIATVASISPSSASICQGASTTFTDATGGGAWVSSNTAVATIGSSSGTATGVSAGSVTITYSVGSCFVISTLTVNPNPSSITPATPISICVGGTASLADATPGGTWSSGSPGIASVGTSGTVTGISAGAATISYTTASGCSATRDVTVNITPVAIFPAGAAVCVGSTTSFTDATIGGTWSSSNVTIATIDPSTGTATGVAPGTVTITYAIGTCNASTTLTVNATPAAITPATPVSICVGATASLSDGTPGGSWSSSNTSVATVGTTGTVTGIATGTVTISYTNSSGCSALKTITVASTPTAIVPISTNVCVGGTTTLTNTVGGGTWTSSNTAIASIGSSSGTVSGISAGAITITYAIGSCQATSTVTVSLAASAGTISGPTSVCVGSTISLIDGAPGGVWSSSNTAIATVGSTGVVTGTGAGIATISYSVTNVCGIVAATATVNVVPSGVLPITGLSMICAGTFTTYSDATPGGTWSVTNATATITSAGLLTGITPGTDTIRYTVTNACGTASVTKVVTIGPFLTAGTITGLSAVCTGATIPLADLAPGGTWSASNGNATVSVSGVVTGISGGIDTIMYTVTSSCGSATATHPVTVTALPNAGGIVGSASMCAGTLGIYTNASGGGVWSLSNLVIATISGSGVITAISPGIDTIKYTVTNSCGTAVTTKVLTIGPALNAGTITGIPTVCAGSSTTLSDIAPGGTWSSTNTAIATVGSTGIVTGVSGGTATISYTVSSSCGTAAATRAVTVNPLPNAGSISGPGSLCVGTVSLYTDAAPGGTWSITNANATITTVGSLTAVSAGLDTIVYTVSNSCGTAMATLPISIGTTATAGTITGPANVCTGSTITLTDGISGGTWSSSNTAVATVGSTGIVTGVSNGTATITYTVSGSCGTATTTAPVTVSPVPSAGPVTGPSTMCSGTFSLFTDPSPGGTWSSSNATATVSGTGVVTAVTPGTDTISYTVSTGCAVATATKIITIVPGAGAGTISGPAAVCVGATITLTDGTPGGTWSSSNGTATVGSTGIVTGITAGLDTILYTVVNSCGTASATHVVAVSSSTFTGTITGPSNVCVGSLIMLTNSVPGGAWGSSNTNATITTGGIVTGITPGTDTITYTVSGACGTASATKTITIDLLPSVGPITGPSTICTGSPTLLSDGTLGGTWSTSNGTATIGSSSGIITGITTGTDTVIYTVSGSCGSISTTTTVTVNPLPFAGTITGPDSVCIGSTITLTDGTPGGTWSAGNANATVSGGTVTGISAGTDPISYSVTNSCGTANAVKVVTVVSFPTSGLITGISTVCVGSGITLTDPVPGGVWLLSNSNAIVAGPGIIDGVTVGVDTVFYVVANSCGASSASKIITVNPVPVVNPISGPTSQCVGTTITLSDVVTGGVWISSTPAVATIGVSTGIATGIATGTTTITYTVTNIFGCPASVTAQDTVTTMPVLPSITGSADVCAGTTTTLSNTTTGGNWTSANPGIATVGALTGMVSGITTGSTTITYTVTNACGTAFTTQAETVHSLPTVSAITGITHQCQGATTTLTDATAGGTWVSSNPAIATVGSSSGIVTGITPGIVSISYLFTGAFGCTAVMFTPDTVVASPSVAAITGITNECIGATTTLSNATPGGTWSSANPAIATVGSTGIVTGVTTGITTINYSVTNGSGCTTVAAATDTSGSGPIVAAIAGTPSVCVGATTTLTDATPGGTWSAANAHATIGSTGIVTGVTAGTDTILYAVTNGCGTTTVTQPITISPLPDAGAITGPANVCAGGTVTLADAATGGTWSATTANATVGSTGIVTGIVTGMDTILYTVSNTCGTAITTHPVAVVTIPATAGTITGSSSVCKGSTATLSNTTAGGTWSATNARAAVSPTGVVTGVNTGADTIIYTVSNACGSVSATKVITITTAPNAGTITGAGSVCIGHTIGLSATGGTSGGTWSSSSPSTASVSPGGVVTGLTPGTAGISYTVSNSCGSRTASHTVTVLTATECNTRVKTTTASAIRIYPNPASTTLNIESPVKVSAIITSIDGKELISVPDAQSIDISTLADGMYLMKIYDENKALLQTTKFVKMK